MKNIRKQMLRIASVNVPVLITGESGAGKEVAARLIHSRCAGSVRGDSDARLKTRLTKRAQFVGSADVKLSLWAKTNALWSGVETPCSVRNTQILRTADSFRKYGIVAKSPMGPLKAIAGHPV